MKFLPCNARRPLMTLAATLFLAAQAVHAQSVVESIGGRLIDADSGHPVAEGRVELFRCADGSCAEYVDVRYSDWQGGFRFFGWEGDLLHPGSYQARVFANGYLAAASEIFTAAEGQVVDVGDVLLSPLPRAGSISGRLVDALSGGAVAGLVVLHRCESGGGCYDPVDQFFTAADGSFRFPSGYWGTFLLAGAYRLTVVADQYQMRETAPFSVGPAEHLDLGQVPIPPLPVQFSTVESCGLLPAEGGACDFSVTVRSGSTERLSATAWALVELYPAGASGMSRFQLQPARRLELAPGQAVALPFTLDVPETLGAGSGLCVRLFVGQNPDPSWAPLGSADLFCTYKQLTGFQTVTAAAAHRLFRGRAAGPQGLPR